MERLHQKWVRTKAWPGWSARLAARSNSNHFLLPKLLLSASVFTAKVCVSFATHGQAFWQRPHTLMATFDTMAWAMTAPSPVSRTV